MQYLRSLMPAVYSLIAGVLVCACSSTTVSVPKQLKPVTASPIISAEVPRLKRKPTIVKHTVKFGESLWSIGCRYGISWRVLAKHNKLPDAYYIRGGRIIEIPLPEGHTCPELHWIKYNECLSVIAEKHKLKTIDLVAANDIKNKNVIWEGFPLKIPTRRDLDAWDQEMSVLVKGLGSDSYKVRRGSHKKLIQARGKAVPSLLKAQNHPDPEIRERVREILSRNYPSGLRD